jgi:hypothetical protein
MKNYCAFPACVQGIFSHLLMAPFKGVRFRVSGSGDKAET